MAMNERERKGTSLENADLGGRGKTGGGGFLVGGKSRSVGSWDKKKIAAASAGGGVGGRSGKLTSAMT